MRFREEIDNYQAFSGLRIKRLLADVSVKDFRPFLAGPVYGLVRPGFALMESAKIMVNSREDP